MWTPGFVDPLPVWIAAAALATLFAHASLTKFGDLALLEQHLHVYGLPMRALPLARLLLPGLELLAAVLLLSPWRSAGAALAGGLLMTYAGVMAWHRAQGHELDCGCGGEPLSVSWALVARNLGLATLALLAGASMSERALSMGDFAVVAAAVALATLLYALLNQVLRHQGAGSTRHPLGRA